MRPSAALLLIAAIAVSIRGDPIRVQVTQEGRSGIVVDLVDCDGVVIRTLPNDLYTEVIATDGYVRPLSNMSAPWRRTSEPRRAHSGDQYELLSNAPLWPEETTIRVKLLNSAGAIVGQGTLKDLLPRVPGWFAFLVALAGATAATIVRLGFTRQRTRASVIYGLIGALVAGALAWTAIETKEVWSFIGFEKPPLRSQSYLLLGLALGAFDPRRLFNKFTRDQEEETLTFREVYDRVTGLLTAENIRKPFREELEQMIFDQRYISEHPTVMARLEGALAAAKKKVNLPQDLSNYLAPRLTRMYLGSYRRSFRLKLYADIDASGKRICWRRNIYYEFVRNDAFSQDGPEVTSSVITSIPEPLRDQTAGSYERFGLVLQSIFFSVRDFQGGLTMEFEGTNGTQLLPVSRSEGAASEPIDVAFNYDAKEKTVRGQFEWNFPEMFRTMPVVSVTIEQKFVAELDDGLWFQSVAQPTFGYNVETHFTPKLSRSFDIAIFEWTEKGRKTSDFDESEGSVQMT